MNRDLSNRGQEAKIPTNKVVFRSCAIEHIASAQTYIGHTEPDPTRCVWLPNYAESKVLLEKYIQDVDPVHHIVHCPSLMSILNEVYTCLSQQGQVKPGKIILLIAIFASCAHSWVEGDSKRGCLFDTPAAATNQSALWIKALEDVLDIAYRTASISVEGIQGIIIAFFVLVCPSCPSI